MKNVIILPEDRQLTEIELKYRYKFLTQMKNYDCELKDDEVFRQMILKINDHKIYNPEWFVSNHAKILTVSRKNIKAIKPQLYFREASKEETLDSKWTDLVKEYYPNWQEKYNQKKIPKEYYVTNSYPASIGLRKSGINVPMHKIVYAYFLDEEKAFQEGIHIHHKIIVDFSQPQEEMNCADNLQAEPDSPHLRMHRFIPHVASLQPGINIVDDRVYDVKIEGQDYCVTPLDIPDPLYHYHLDSQGKVEWLLQEERSL